MYILVGAAAFVAGVVIAALLLCAAVRAENARRRKKRRTKPPPAAQGEESPAAPPEKNKRKIEFVKIIVFVVLLTYFVGVYIGARIVFIDFSQLGVLLAFIGTPTAAAIGFYCWKAKAENIIKIKKDNPEETQGIPVDLNNINQ